MFQAWNINHGAARIGHAFGRANALPSAPERFVAITLVLALGLVMLALIIPLALLFLVAALLLATFRGLGRLVARTRRPNGAFDGRKNVRVILPDDTPR